MPNNSIHNGAPPNSNGDSPLNSPNGSVITASPEHRDGMGMVFDGRSHRLASPTPTGNNNVLDLGAVLSALWRRRKLMLTTFLLVVLAGTLITMRQPSVYESTCSILITSPSDTSPTVSDSLRDLLNASQPRSVGTQLAIMRSYPVQRATLKRLTPEEREVAKRYYKIEVRPQRDSDAIDIVAESYDPKVSAQLANSLSDEYMWQYQQQNRAQVKAGTREVANQLEGARRRLTQASNDLKDYKQNNGTVDLGEESKARLSEINQIEGSLRDLRAERAANVARIQSMNGQISAMPKVEVIPDRIVRRPALEALQGQLTQLELQRISTLQRYRPGSPEVRSLEDQRSAIQARLKTMAQTQVSSWIRSVNPVRQGLAQEIASTQSNIWSIDARAKALENSAEQARSKESQLPEREFRLNQLLTEQTVLQQTYQVLNEKYQSLLVSEGAKLTTARPLAPAEAPSSPIRPRRSLSLIMSIALGLALAVALAALVEHMDDRIHTVEDLKDVAGLPVLAQIPFISDREKRTLLAKSNSSLPLLESFRLLRTQLIISGRGEGTVAHLPRSVMITSSHEGEGKSLCALNLALATALADKQVLLIDCNLRRPTLHTLLNLQQKPGFSDVAQGLTSFENALQVTEIPNLQVLTCGIPTLHVTELLDSDAARQALQTAISKFDLVVLDCPAVLNLADTPIIATIAHAALLVVACEDSEGSEIAQTCEQLERTGIPLAGIILNKDGSIA